MNLVNNRKAIARVKWQGICNWRKSEKVKDGGKCQDIYNSRVQNTIFF